jgi:hypothetical protein
VGGLHWRRGGKSVQEQHEGMQNSGHGICGYDMKERRRGRRICEPRRDFVDSDAGRVDLWLGVWTYGWRCGLMVGSEPWYDSGWLALEWYSIRAKG